MLYSQQKEEDKMKPIFNKPVLEQLFNFRKEEFDQDVYDNNNEIREIEQEV